MGIDYDGGMIVGIGGSEISVPEEFLDDLHEWAEEQNMDNMSPYYDCPTEDRIFGFNVKDVLVKDMDEEWLADVKAKADKFKKLTGLDAMLIGIQNIW